MSIKLRKHFLLVMILFLLSYSFNLGNLSLHASAASSWNTSNPGFQYTSNNVVGYGDGQWLLFNSSREFGKSSNGANWDKSLTNFPCSVADAFYWKESPGNTKWITACEEGQIYTLHEGDDPIGTPSKWVHRAAGVNFGYGFYSIAASDNKVVIVGDNSTIRFSTDAENWTNYSPGNGVMFYGVTYGEGKFIAVGVDFGPAIYTSLDGQQWDRLNSPMPSQELYGITYGAGKFVAVGPMGYVYVSEDGVTWEEKYPPSAIGGNDLYTVTYGSGKFYAAGSNETIISSADGLNWFSEYQGTSWMSFFSIRASEAGVIATGESGIVKTFIKSSNNKLSSLTIDHENLNFSPDQENYSTTVKNSVASLNVTAAVQDPTAAVSINGTVGTSNNIQLNVGSNTINVSVKAENGAIKNYSIEVFRAAPISSNAKLSHLTVAPGDLSESFNPEVLNYTVTVEHFVNSIDVTSVLADGNSTLTVDGVAANSGVAIPVTLNVDNPTVIPVIVTAQDGVTNRTYTLTVTKEAPPAENSTISPVTSSFDQKLSAQTDVTTTLTLKGNTLTSITDGGQILQAGIDYTVSDNGLVTINKEYLSTKPIGITTLTFTFSAGNDQSLAISVNDTSSNNANLMDLIISAGSLTPSFNSGEFEYIVSVANSTNSIEVTPIVSDNLAKVKVNNQIINSGSPSTISLTIGENTIPIEVTAEDGKTVKSYILKVTRDKGHSERPSVTGAITEEDTMNGNGLVIHPVLDPDRTDASYFKITNIIGGTLYKNDGSFPINNGDFISLIEGDSGLKFQPNQDAFGTTGFGFDVQAAPGTDGEKLSDPVHVSIVVTEVNDVPVVVEDQLEHDVTAGTGDVSIPFSDLLTNDSAGPSNEAGQTLTIVDVTNETGGTARIEGGNVIFTPEQGFIGLVNFNYTIEDNGTTNGSPDPQSDTGTVRLNIVEPPKSANSDLSNIILSSGSLDSVFSADDLEYSVGIDHAVETLTLTPSTADAKATIVINGISVQNGEASSPIHLSVGENEITIVITAENGNTKTYTVKVNRQKGDQLAPIGLTGVAPTVEGNNGKINGTTDGMEYRLKGTENWIQATDQVTNGLAAGIFEVRFAAKTGYNPSPAVEVVVFPYIAPVIPPSTGGSTNETVRQGDVGVGNDTTAKVDIVRSSENNKKVDSIVLNDKLVEDSVQKAVQQNKDSIVIRIPDLPSDLADEITVKIQKQALNLLTQSQVAVSLQTDDVTIDLPDTSVSQLNETEDELYFKVVPIRQEEEKNQIFKDTVDAELVKQQAGDKQVQVFGKPMIIETNYRDQKTLVTFSLKDIELPKDPTERAEVLNSLAVYIQHSDGEKAVQRGVIQYDSTGNPVGVSIEITKFSTFTIIGLPTTAQNDEQDQDPIIHKEPVARIIVKKPVALLKRNQDGTYISTGLITEGAIRVYGFSGDYYNVGGQYYVKNETGKTIMYEGRVLIKKATPLYSPDGKIARMLKVGEAIKVYSQDSDSFDVGAGYKIKYEKDKTVFYSGMAYLKKDTVLYKGDGTKAQTLKRGKQYRVYKIEGNKIYVGGNYYLIADKKVIDYKKN